MLFANVQGRVSVILLKLNLEMSGKKTGSLYKNPGTSHLRLRGGGKSVCNWPFYASLALALQVIPGLQQAHSEGGKRKIIKEVASWISILRASESAYVSSEDGPDAEMNKGW